MKLIDFEHHYYAPEFFEMIASRTEAPCYNPENKMLTYVKRQDGLEITTPLPIMDQLLDFGEERIRQMDKYGIDVAVLGCSAGQEQIKGADGIRIAQISNDRVAEYAGKYPGRLLGSAILPMMEPDAACKELERCVKELGFVGWHTHSNYGDKYLDEAMFRPILKKAEELGVYVYVHPACPTDYRLVYRGCAFNMAGFGFTVDTMNTVMGLILNGILDELPGLKVLVGHLAEALPFLLKRLDKNYSRPHLKASLKNKRNISEYFKTNIIATTSGNMCPEAFELTKNVMGIENMVVGTDYPYEELAEMMDFLEHLNLTDKEREQLYYKNGEKLFAGITKD